MFFVLGEFGVNERQFEIKTKKKFLRSISYLLKDYVFSVASFPLGFEQKKTKSKEIQRHSKNRKVNLFLSADKEQEQYF